MPAQRRIHTQVGAAAAAAAAVGLKRQRARARLASTAAPAQPTFHDHLVSTAEILLAHARMQQEEQDLDSEEHADGDNTASNREAKDPVQAAKRESEMEKIRVALQELDDVQEVCGTFLSKGFNHFHSFLVLRSGSL